MRSEGVTAQSVANQLKNTEWYLQAVPVPLHTLLLVGKLKAGNSKDIEKSLTNNPGGCVVDFP